MLLNPRLARLASLSVLLVAALPVRANDANPRIAVLDFQRVRAEEAEATAAADQLRTELVKQRAFIVLDREQTEAVLAELAFQQEGITEPSQAAALGKMLNVQYIVTGRLTKLRDAYQVNAHLIRVETGEIVRSESALHTGEFIGLLTGQMPKIAAGLAGLEPAPRRVEVTPAPPAVPPSSEAGQWPASPRPAMGMMHGGDPMLPMGGMMLIGGAVMASRSDPEHQGAALALGAIGAALVLYYLWSDDPPRATDLDSSARPGLLFSPDVRPEAPRASISWRWNW